MHCSGGDYRRSRRGSYIKDSKAERSLSLSLSFSPARPQDPARHSLLSLAVDTSGLNNDIKALTGCKARDAMTITFPS